jgi:hypothetical protein
VVLEEGERRWKLGLMKGKKGFGCGGDGGGGGGFATEEKRCFS